MSTMSLFHISHTVVGQSMAEPPSTVRYFLVRAPDIAAAVRAAWTFAGEPVVGSWAIESGAPADGAPGVVSAAALAS